MSRFQRTYDHRLRDLVRRTHDVTLATRAGVPRSTATGWLRRPVRQTVSLDVLSRNERALQAEVIRLRRRVRKLCAVARILMASIKVFDLDLEDQRVPDGASKSLILRAIERADGLLKFRTALALIGLSPSRFHAWRRASKGCELDDHSSCPNVSPHRVTLVEIQTIKEMVTSPDYRHVSTGTLAVLAQRLGRVFASASTWRRLVRERGWRRALVHGPKRRRTSPTIPGFTS